MLSGGKTHLLTPTPTHWLAHSKRIFSNYYNYSLAFRYLYVSALRFNPLSLSHSLSLSHTHTNTRTHHRSLPNKHTQTVSLSHTQTHKFFLSGRSKTNKNTNRLQFLWTALIWCSSEEREEDSFGGFSHLFIAHLGKWVNISKLTTWKNSQHI